MTPDHETAARQCTASWWLGDNPCALLTRSNGRDSEAPARLGIPLSINSPRRRLERVRSEKKDAGPGESPGALWAAKSELPGMIQSRRLRVLLWAWCAIWLAVVIDALVTM